MVPFRNERPGAADCVLTEQQMRLIHRAVQFALSGPAETLPVAGDTKSAFIGLSQSRNTSGLSAATLRALSEAVTIHQFELEFATPDDPSTAEQIARMQPDLIEEDDKHIAGLLANQFQTEAMALELGANQF